MFNNSFAKFDKALLVVMLPRFGVELVVKLESIKSVYECFGKLLELQFKHSLPL